MSKFVRKTLGLGLAAAGFAAGMYGSTALTQPEVLSDIGYHRGEGDPRFSDTEARMARALNTVFGADVVVRCAEPVEDSKTKFSPKDGTGNSVAVSSTQDLWFSWSDRRYVRLAPELCGAIADIDGIQPKTEATKFAAVAYALSALTFQGEQAAHEGQDASAGAIECYSIQDNARVAMEMGASLEGARALGIGIADAAPLLSGPDQEPPRNCVDGDATYDLIPGSPGFMPYDGSEVRPAGN